MNTVATTPTQTPPAELSDAALAAFTDYFVRNYPGTVTISYPEWHAPRIFRAAIEAYEAARELPAASLGEDVLIDDVPLAKLQHGKEYLASVELPDEIRVPLDEVWADAETLIARAQQDSSFRPVAVASIKRRIDEAKLAIKCALLAPTPSAAGSGDAAHDFSDNEGATCLNCGTSNWAACTPCSPPAKPEAGEVVGFDAWWKSFPRISAESPDTMDDRTFAEIAWSAALTAKAEGDGGEWRLLTRADAIENGDEFLGDDTLTWKPLAGWERGMRYDPGAFVPARRRVTTKANP